MQIAPPSGSRIEVAARDGAPALIVPQPARGLAQIGMTLFLGFWLCGWVLGFSSVLGQILAGKAAAFLYFWLGGWTAGGVFVSWIFVNSIRSQAPAELILKAAGLAYDSGRAAPKFERNLQQNPWRALKRSRGFFPPAELRSLALRETGEGNRLTIDRGAERIDLLPNASEVDREWVYNLLRDRYPN